MDITLSRRLIVMAVVVLAASLVTGVALEVGGVADGGYWIELLGALTGFSAALVIAGPLLRRISVDAAANASRRDRRQALKVITELNEAFVTTYSRGFGGYPNALHGVVEHMTSVLQRSHQLRVQQLTGELTIDAAQLAEDLAVIAPAGHGRALAALRMLATRAFPRAAAGLDHMPAADAYAEAVTNFELAVVKLELEVVGNEVLLANTGAPSVEAHAASLLQADERAALFERRGRRGPHYWDVLFGVEMELPILIEVAKLLEQCHWAASRGTLRVASYGETPGMPTRTELRLLSRLESSAREQ